MCCLMAMIAACGAGCGASSSDAPRPTVFVRPAGQSPSTDSAVASSSAVALAAGAAALGSEVPTADVPKPDVPKALTTGLPAIATTAPPAAPTTAPPTATTRAAVLLPADLRADVPLPQGATLLNVTRSPAPDGEALVLSFERPAIKGDPLAELSAAFVARGWVQGVHSDVNQSGFSGLASFSTACGSKVPLITRQWIASPWR